MSGIIVYGDLCLKTMYYSGIKTSKTLKIVLSNLILFIPAGIALTVLKTAGINQILLVVISSLVTCTYCLYILKKDEQVKEIVEAFKLPGKL